VDNAGSGQTLGSALRRVLTTRGNRLRATIVIGRSGPTEALVAQLRQMFAGADLIKARVDVERGAAADAVAQELAHRVPCHVVKRIGKVVLLYQPRQECEEASTAGSG
jgi:RNA-binding protein YhbY